MLAAVVREHGDIGCIRLEDDFPEPVLESGWAKSAVRA